MQYVVRDNRLITQWRRPLIHYPNGAREVSLKLEYVAPASLRSTITFSHYPILHFLPYAAVRYYESLPPLKGSIAIEEELIAPVGLGLIESRKVRWIRRHRHSIMR